jgi:outer membrane protein OmpU
MNNFRKIGMTALAASLVSTSAFAGEITASASASLTMEGWSGSQVNTSRAISMADSVMLTGSTELDNGLTVSMSFELDDSTDVENSFDDHSVSISSDSLGTVKFSGNGGSTASSAIDATAAGDLWDNFDTSANIGAAGTAVSAAAAGNNNVFYTSPDFEGFTLTASYRQDGSPEMSGTTALGNFSATGIGANYTGVEGLSAHYALTDVETNAANSTGEQTSMKITYAYGPVTVGYSNNDYDVGLVSSDQETTSYNISYTVSESISIGYGQETIDDGDSTKVDAEYSGVNASYTAGGMTISAKMIDAENVAGGTGATEDGEYWSLGLAFAF